MSSSVRKPAQGSEGAVLVEEAVALLRAAPISAHLAYYLGAIPFWLGLLYFISDMSRSAYAPALLPDWSLAVAALYLWKKCWQTVAAAQLRAMLGDGIDEPWSVHRVMRMVVVQATLQPWGLFLRPIAAVITLPYFWVAAFFQNVTILGDGSTHQRSVHSRALEQAKLWPTQGHIAVSVLLLVTVVVWMNVTASLAALPSVLKMLLGLETDYSRHSQAMLNTTFLTATCGLTSLIVDPVRKACFILRCFRGASIRTGQDLAADLKRLRSAAVTLAMAVAILFASPIAWAQPEPAASAPISAGAADLDRRIGQVLERREYSWRSPRERKEKGRSETWIGSFIDSLRKRLESFADATGKVIGRFLRWLGRIFTPARPPVPNGPPVDWIGLSKAVSGLVIALLIGALGWLCYRAWCQRRRETILTVAPLQSVPDLRAEDIVADQLPEDEWMRMSRELAQRGEWAMAIRAAWLAGLAHLGGREYIGIARHKSNRDYERELRRRARDRNAVLTAFRENLLSYESAWYGRHPANAGLYDVFQGNLDRIREV